VHIYQLHMNYILLIKELNKAHGIAIAIYVIQKHFPLMVIQMTNPVNEMSLEKQYYRIQVINRAQEYRCEAGKNLLTGMESDNKQCINIGCRGGGCGVCKIRVIAGIYQQKRMSKAHISTEDKVQGFALACRIFPSGDMVIESDHNEIPADSDKSTERELVEQL